MATANPLQNLTITAVGSRQLGAYIEDEFPYVFKDDKGNDVPATQRDLFDYILSILNSLSGILPEYKNNAEAVAALGIGKRWKTASNNTFGLPKGVILETY